MGVREIIMNSTMSRNAAFVGASAALIAGGVFIGPTASASAAPNVTASASLAKVCSLAPDARAANHTKRCGYSQIHYGYKSNRVVGKKRCYYFLATAWNPCSTPVQYGAQACKAI